MRGNHETRFGGIYIYIPSSVFVLYAYREIEPIRFPRQLCLVLAAEHSVNRYSAAFMRRLHAGRPVSRPENVAWLARMDRANVEVVIVVVAAHNIYMTGRGPGRPHGQGGIRHCTYYSSKSTPHFMGRGPGRPVKTRGSPHGLGSAAHINPTFHGPRPGPVL